MPGFDAEAISPFEMTGKESLGSCSLGRVVGGAGDSLMGDSSLMEAGSIILRRLMDLTRKVAIREGFAVDFRRSFSLLEADVLLGVGMASKLFDGLWFSKL